jgi:hypothetical protein
MLDPACIIGLVIIGETTFSFGRAYARIITPCTISNPPFSAPKTRIETTPELNIALCSAGLVVFVTYSLFMHAQAQQDMGMEADPAFAAKLGKMQAMHEKHKVADWSIDEDEYKAPTDDISKANKEALRAFYEKHDAQKLGKLDLDDTLRKYSTEVKQGLRSWLVHSIANLHSRLTRSSTVAFSFYRSSSHS